MLDFVHLHVHSCCSFHEGTDFPAELASRAARLGFRALALSDTNGLYGAVPFVKAAREEGIEPILGVHLDGGREEGSRAVVLGRGEEQLRVEYLAATRGNGRRPVPVSEFLSRR